VLLWPAVTVLALYWLAYFVLARLETFYFIGFLFNLASAFLLAIFFIVWWWTNRSLSLRSRLYGFLLMVAAVLIVEPLCHASIGWWGLLMSGLPVVLTVWFLWLIVAKRAWPSRQWSGSAVVVALTLAYFTIIRIDGLDSNLRGDLHWRWNPSPEELFLAEKHHTADDDPDLAGTPPAKESIILEPGDWPGFRGPNRDGAIRGITIAIDWDTSPPRLRWRQRVGPAWSSVIVVGDRLYTQEQRGDLEAVVCYEAQTGRELWSHEDATRFWESVSGAGPRATPTFANGRIYALGGTGILNCLDAATGERYWSHHIAADAGTRPPQWGFSGTPLVTDGLVIAFVGGEGDKSLLAYHADTGEPAWAASIGGSSYSSPQPVILAGQRQVLILSDHGLAAVDPATGAVLWEGGTAMPGAPRTGQPHAVGAAQLLVATYDGVGVTLLDVNHDGDAWNLVPRWTSKDLKPEFPDLVVHRDHAYGFDVSIFCCIDLATGKRCWKEGRYGRGQVMLLADQALLLVMAENGEVVLLAADPKRHHELGRFRALDGKTWNHPVLAQGRLYARNAEEMACYELSPAPRSAHVHAKGY
jgi:outer membrane protein assembly factor BamB